MVILYLVYAVLLGAAVGSFLNVVVFRFHTGRSVSGRSSCPHCSRKLLWYDLVPIFSFVALRGRCRFCRVKISWQYPLVEFLTALIFFCIGWQIFHASVSTQTVVWLLFSLMVWPLLIVILAYDIRHKIIPDSLVFSFVFLALLLRVFDGWMQGFGSSFWFDLAAGPLLFLPFFLLWKLSGGRWMGLGDGKLAFGIGLMLGLGGGISAVVLGFWIGAAVGLVLIFISRFRVLSRVHVLKRMFAGVTMKSEIPFAPFLIAGIFVVEFTGFSLFAFGL